MNKKKIMSLIMALVMLVGVFSPLTAMANNENEPGNPQTPRTGNATTSTFTADDISETYPKDGKTTLIIHKLQSSSFNVTSPGKTHDGGKLGKDAIQALGKTPKGLNGVEFKYYKVDDETKFKAMVDAPESYKTTAQVEAYLTGVTGTTVTTATVDGEKGIIKLADIEKGNYWFVETGNYTKDTSDKDAPDNISSYIAVPFGITLPLTNTTKITVGNKTYEPGTVWLKNVHTYPKNVTGNEPEPKKTVEDLKKVNTTKSVGDPVKWHLNATIPGNIKDYTEFGFTDALDDAITYVGKIKVRYGSGDKTNFEDLENELDATTDYTIKRYSDKTFTTETQNDAEVKSFTVELTKAGIAKLAQNIGTITNPIISVEFESKLNDKAKVDTGNPNEYTLKWNNGKGKKDKKSNKPRVFTGEKKFVKTDEQTKEVLKGATFIVKNNKKEAPKQFLKVDKDTKAVSWVAEAEATPFTTTDGTITIGKLEYTYPVKGNPEDEAKVEVDKTAEKINEYQLIETQAPEGYGKLQNPINFDIDNESYKGNVTIDQGKIKTDEAKGEYTEVPNKKLTIPQTGGMGTVLFTVVGISLMAGAVIAMKKNREEA